MKRQKKIVVVGSTNVDLIARIAHLPQPGETIGEAEYVTSFGGKGANQALAAARSGGDVTFISCLGDDAYSDAIISSFASNGIHVDHIQQCSGQSTGVAFIFVAENGENCIAVAPGANNLLQMDKIDAILSVIKEADVLVLQLEIPHQSVITLIDYAHNVGTKILLNPAPAKEIPAEILDKVDILILNETEASLLTGQSLDTSEPINIARTLCKREGQVVILTLGQNGSIVISRDMEEQIPAYKVKTLDTTGAGDTFCGAFVSRWIEDGRLIEAVRFATAAAALSVTKIGAQSSIPLEVEVLDFLHTK